MPGSYLERAKEKKESAWSSSTPGRKRRSIQKKGRGEGWK